MPADARTRTATGSPSRWRTWSAGAAKLTVSLLLLWLVLRRFSYQELAAQVARTRLEALVLPLLMILASNLLGALQWGTLVRASGLTVARGRLLRLYFASLFFSNLGVGNLGGDAYKIFKLGRSEGALGRVAGATIVDRVVGASALCALALIVAAGSLGREHVPGFLSLLVLACSFVILGLSAVVLHPASAARFERLLRSLPWPSINTRLARLLGYLREYGERVPVLRAVFLLSLVIQSARVGAHYCVGLAMGLDLHASDLSKFFLVIPILGLLVALPLSIGGWGVREWAGAVLFVPLGRSGEEAVTLLALTATLTFLVNLVGGLVVWLWNLPRPERLV